MAMSMFVRIFSMADDENEREELYIQFADAYDGSIKDWKEKVEERLESEELREKFRGVCNCKKEIDIKKFVTIEPLRLEDLGEVSGLASKELDMTPWIGREQDSIVDFVNGGRSYVARREGIVLGFILAYKCPAYGGSHYIYIDTFVVDGGAQGYGVGKMLLNQVRKDMLKEGILFLKLMTKKDIQAYKIYKHFGFEEIDDCVHMRKWL